MTSPRAQAISILASFLTEVSEDLSAEERNMAGVARLLALENAGLSVVNLDQLLSEFEEQKALLIATRAEQRPANGAEGLALHSVLIARLESKADGIEWALNELRQIKNRQGR